MMELWKAIMYRIWNSIENEAEKVTWVKVPTVLVLNKKKVQDI